MAEWPAGSGEWPETAAFYSSAKRIRRRTVSPSAVPAVPEQFPPIWSVIVPVRDEAGNIAPLAAEIDTAMAVHGPYELIVVDDGSRDGTAAELMTVASALPNLHVQTHRRSCGQSQALITGAIAARGVWIITLDGDGQNDPVDIAKLMAALSAQSDAQRARTMVIGRRARRKDGGLKTWASAVAWAARAVVLADATPDAGCGLKLLSRELFLALPRFDALHRFMPVLVRRAGGVVVSVDVAHRPRRHGRSKYGIVKRGLVGVVDLLGVWWLVRRHTLPPQS
ncbi:MAG: glycosyltransferase [Rhodospirillaceae bacterium]|nr:glycosyltransferase [Rhodospirillaceae bacterium]